MIDPWNVSLAMEQLAKNAKGVKSFQSCLTVLAIACHKPQQVSQK
jgi:hypothetical protein